MIPPNQKISIERDIYPKIAGNGLYGFPFEGYFIDSGTPKSYLEANFKCLGNMERLRTLEPASEEVA